LVPERLVSTLLPGLTIKLKIMKSSGKILAAVAAGIAAGAVLGILFAPDKGSETRRKISERGKRFSDDAKDMIQKGKEKLNDLKEEIEKTVADAAEKMA
jgi:gas vesicle protein